jgi:hypothetical protein
VQKSHLVLAIIAAVVALYIRLLIMQASDFPVGDGGLSYVMVADLQRAGYQLPISTTYNGNSLPFAYPPLPFYVAGLLSQLTGWSLLAIFRYLPTAVTVVTVLAFFGLSRALLTDGAGPVLAAFAFAVLPETSRWPIMGGGLTRSLGMFFAILALTQTFWLYQAGKRRHFWLALLFSACTMLSHPEMTLFLASSTALLLLSYGRNRTCLRRTLLLAFGTILVTAPWWATVAARHGIAVLLAATQAGWPLFSGLVRMLIFGATSEPFIPVLGFLAFLGVLACLAARRWLLPAWLFVVFLLDAWLAAWAATVPLALLISLGITDVVYPLLTGQTAAAGPVGQLEPELPAGGKGRTTSRRLVQAFVPVVLIVYMVISAVFAASSPAAGLSAGERAAMDWIAVNTPVQSTFLVISSDAWGTDWSSEWFPALAQRVSLATVQDKEWLPGGEFSRSVQRNQALQACATQGVDCLESWIAQTGLAPDLIFVPKRAPARTGSPSPVMAALRDDCCRSLRNSLGANLSYSLVYDDPGAAVFVRRSGGNP